MICIKHGSIDFKYNTCMHHVYLQVINGKLEARGGGGSENIRMNTND
jgi:hypothetical protein